MPADPAFWDNLAEGYAAQPVADPDAFERKIAITRSLVSPTAVVLNIGCGTGSLALRLADSAAHVHGLDLSPEMIRIARGKAEGHDNLTFHVGAFDESFTAFEDESLDGICAFSILHLVDDRQAALAQIHRLLKPGGFFVSSTVCLGGSWVPYGVVLTVLRWLGKAPMVQVFGKETLASEIREAGFVEVSQPDVGAKSNIGFMVASKAG